MPSVPSWNWPGVVTEIRRHQSDRREPGHSSALPREYPQRDQADRAHRLPGAGSRAAISSPRPGRGDRRGDHPGSSMARWIRVRCIGRRPRQPVLSHARPMRPHEPRQRAKTAVESVYDGTSFRDSVVGVKKTSAAAPPSLLHLNLGAQHDVAAAAACGSWPPREGQRSEVSPRALRARVAGHCTAPYPLFSSNRSPLGPRRPNVLNPRPQLYPSSAPPRLCASPPGSSRPNVLGHPLQLHPQRGPPISGRKSFAKVTP